MQLRKQVFIRIPGITATSRALPRGNKYYKNLMSQISIKPSMIELDKDLSKVCWKRNKSRWSYFLYHAFNSFTTVSCKNFRQPHYPVVLIVKPRYGIHSWNGSDKSRWCWIDLKETWLILSRSSTNEGDKWYGKLKMRIISFGPSHLWK